MYVVDHLIVLPLLESVMMDFVACVYVGPLSCSPPPIPIFFHIFFFIMLFMICGQVHRVVKRVVFSAADAL